MTAAYKHLVNLARKKERKIRGGEGKHGEKKGDRRGRSLSWARGLSLLMKVVMTSMSEKN